MRLKSEYVKENVERRGIRKEKKCGWKVDQEKCGRKLGKKTKNVEEWSGKNLVKWKKVEKCYKRREKKSKMQEEESYRRNKIEEKE